MKMENLYDAFRKVVDRDILNNVISVSSNEEADKEAEKKIRDVFGEAGKSACFSSFDESCLTRTFHSISVYFIGLYLFRNGFLTKANYFNVKKIEGFNFKTGLSNDFEKELKEQETEKEKANSAIYIWALTSLYHDVMSNRELNKLTKLVNTVDNYYLTPVSFFNYSDLFGENPLSHTIFSDDDDVKALTKDITIFDESNKRVTPFEPTYSDGQIEGYFRKRLHDGCFDHGIASGYVFYDRLVRNYIEKERKYPSKNLDGSFSDEGNTYRPEHLVLFKYIADAIIAHNIWRYNEDTRPEYVRFGIDGKNMQVRHNRFTLQETSLLYFLCLIDTIEPTKFFRSKDISDKAILEGIDLEINKNTLTLEVKADVLKAKKGDWFKKNPIDGRLA